MSRTRLTSPILALSVVAGLLAAATPASASRPEPQAPPAWTVYGDVIVEVMGHGTVAPGPRVR